MAISVILGCLLPLAVVELHGVGACHIIVDLLLCEVVGCLHVAAAALVVILGGGVNLVGGVADPVIPVKHLWTW